MYYVYKLTFLDRLKNNNPPYYYIGSKSRATFENGLIIRYNGKAYYGSSTWKDYDKIINENKGSIKIEIMHEFPDTIEYSKVIQAERQEHIVNDVAASPLYFNKSIATENVFGAPNYATVKHVETGKVVRIPKDHPLILNKTYVGVTTGRDVTKDKNHRNRASVGKKNGFFGKRHSDDVLESIRQQNIGRKASDETRRKLSIAGRGRPKSEEHKKKIGRPGLVMIKDVTGVEFKRVPKEEVDILYATGRWIPATKGNKQVRLVCVYCKKETSVLMHRRFHGKKCRTIGGRWWEPWNHSYNIKNKDYHFIFLKIFELEEAIKNIHVPTRRSKDYVKNLKQIVELVYNKKLNEAEMRAAFKIIQAIQTNEFNDKSKESFIEWREINASQVY